MTLTRRTVALAALALTLVLGACSTPDDLTTPTLEPQFGTSENDYGVDVAYNSTGRVYVLSESEGYTYDEYGYESGSLDDTVLSRYDGNGNFLWSRTVASARCSFDDYYCDDTALKANTLVADTQGYSYALVTYSGITGDCSVSSNHYVEKYDASGRFVREVYVGTSGAESLSPSSASTPVDLAVDGSGNLYAVRQEAEFDDGCFVGSSNVISKYSATGTLLWQRTSPVGTLYGVTVSSNGNVYVGGSGGVAKYTNAGNLSWTTPGDTRDVAAVGTNTVYARNLTTVRKLDANRKQLWSKTQTGLSGVITIADMTTDASANVYITGKFGPSGNRDGFVRKLAASSGATTFSKTVATPAYDDARGVATLNGSEVFITGATQGPLAPPYEGRQDSNDGYVRKLGSSGGTVWTR